MGRRRAARRFGNRLTDTVCGVIRNLDPLLYFDPATHQSERERIFSKFYKAGGAQGTGLGLFIAQGLVREMGGRMWVDSEEGRGSRFAFELPLAQRDG